MMCKSGHEWRNALLLGSLWNLEVLWEEGEGGKLITLSYDSNVRNLFYTFGRACTRILGRARR